MFRSRLIIDRKFRRRNRNLDVSSGNISSSNATKETNSKIRTVTVDGNNNFSRRENNFDFIEPCDIVDDLNNEIDSLDSLEVKNWRYHLTNNRF